MTDDEGVPHVLEPPPTLQIKRLYNDVTMPVRAYGESAGLDLSAYLVGTNGRLRTATLGPGVTQIIPTGLAIRGPRDHVLLVCSRSGLASKGVFVTNAPGVVDPDYTGEIRVILTNAGMDVVYIKHGDRIGQLVVVPFLPPTFEEVDALPETERGEKGFGSTGR